MWEAAGCFGQSGYLNKYLEAQGLPESNAGGICTSLCLAWIEDVFDGKRDIDPTLYVNHIAFHFARQCAYEQCIGKNLIPDENPHKTSAGGVNIGALYLASAGRSLQPTIYSEVCSASVLMDKLQPLLGKHAALLIFRFSEEKKRKYNALGHAMAIALRADPNPPLFFDPNAGQMRFDGGHDPAQVAIATIKEGILEQSDGLWFHVVGFDKASGFHVTT